MPALPVVPNVIQVVLQWHVEGDLSAINKLFFSYTGGSPTESIAEYFATNICTILEGYWQNYVSTLTGIDSVQVTDLSSDMGVQVTGGTPWAGMEGSSPMPPSAAVVVSHEIGRRYRGGHPRSYLPMGQPTDLANSGVWSDDFVANVDTAWGDAISAIKDLGESGTSIQNIVNVSYYKGSTVVISPTTGRARNVPTRRTDPVVDVITGHVTRKTVGSQRRRNRDA